MAQYKVIQDIEAEDKLVGPLTLRQFIYAGVAAVCLYICFVALTRNVAFLIAFFLPPAAVAGFFAFPWKGEQPTEIWALARIRFSIKPRVRIWDQDGVKDLVTVTVPKKLEIKRSSKADLSQDQVRSRLKALADTIDSRGWATRNAAYGIYGQQWAHPTVAPVPANNELASMIPGDDMFDEKSTVSQNFDAMLNKSQEQQRQRVMQQMVQAQDTNQQSTGMPQLPTPLMSSALPNIPTPAAASAYDVAPASVPMPTMGQQNQPMAQMPTPVMQPPTQPLAQQQAPAAPQANYWFANGPAYPSIPSQPVANPIPAQPLDPGTNRIESDMPLAVAATPTPEEAALAESIKQQNQAAMAINYGHMRVLQPVGTPGSDQYNTDVPTAAATPPTTPAEPVTRTPDPAILELASNDDLDIATIARQAKREIDKSPNEVEIRLH